MLSDLWAKSLLATYPQSAVPKPPGDQSQNQVKVRGPSAKGLATESRLWQICVITGSEGSRIDEVLTR
jgi:hypothetical protein